MTASEKDNVLRSLPSINDDSAWATLPLPQRRRAFDHFILKAADLYQLSRLVRIGGVNRVRIEKRFYDVIGSIPWELLEPMIKHPTKEELYPILVVARLQSLPLPAPITYFAP